MIKINEYHRPKKIRRPQEISIMQLPKETDKEVAFSMAIDNRMLINAICEFSKELRKSGVAVFERKMSVVETSIGFYFAIFEEEKVIVESGQFNPEKNEGSGSDNS